MKKGFTLVELIAVPIVLNIIKYIQTNRDFISDNFLSYTNVQYITST